MIDILKKLISFETTPNNFQEKKNAIFWIKKRLSKFPLYFRYFEFSRHPSLVILTKKTKTPFVWLAGHIDVVPGSKGLFRSRIRGRKLIGRGAFDMKFAIACYLRLCEELNKELEKYNFGIMITSDEEIGGFYGTKKILEKGYSGKICFLPDGGSNWQFELQAKGILQLKVESLGKSVHSSRTWEGQNAIENLILFLADVKKIFSKIPQNIKNHWHPTLNIGKIEGGKAINQVPDFCQAFLDIRYPSNFNIRSFEEELQKLKKIYPKIKIKKFLTGNFYFIDPKNEYLKIFSQITKEKFKIKTGFSLSHGSSDGRFFFQKKIPTILIKPKGGNHHADNEWIDIRDLERFYEVLLSFVKKVSQG